MKLRYLASALALMASVAAVFANDPEDVRIYINPGHGSWTANDRPMQVVGKAKYTAEGTDSTNFFESNTDLEKGFGCLEKLIQMGVPFDRDANQTGERWQIGAARDLEQNLVMSRVKNGPYDASNVKPTKRADNPERWDYFELYNRALFDICCEVEYNEFDMFISIHSNAASSTTVNYHLFMYRGKNNDDYSGGGKEMAKITSERTFKMRHMQFTESAPYIYGDVDFMGDKGTGTTNDLGYRGYLGVLKHRSPGYLVEGYFHTYLPGMHRAMNWDVDRIEGYQYARGVGDIFEFEDEEETGEIWGIVRDRDLKFTYDKLWIPRPGSEDIRMPLNNTKVYLWKDGEIIKDYTTDNFYNGCFVFYDLEPGTYQLTFDNEAYREAEPFDVEVEAGAVSYPACYLVDKFRQGRPGEELNYPNIVDEKAAKVEADYVTTWKYTDKAIAELAGKTPSRIMWNKGNAYILAHDAENNATLLVVDPATGNVIANVDTEGCLGTEMNLSDFQVTGDGTLVAMGCELMQSDDKYVKEGQVRGELKVYYWAKDANGLPTGKPLLMGKMPQTWNGNFYAAITGESFVYRGTLEDGHIAYTAQNISSTQPIRHVVCAVKNGALDIEDEDNTYISLTKLTKKKSGKVRYTVSPLDRYKIFCATETTNEGILEYDLNGNADPSTSSTKNLPYDQALSSGFFRYAGAGMMTWAAADEAATTVSLYDITTGIDAPVTVNLSSNKLDGAATNVITTGFPQMLDLNGTATPGFSVLVLRDNKLSCLSANDASGVADITADSNDYTVEYFDLGGRKLKANDLTPGIYIRRAGTKAEKVIIR